MAVRATPGRSSCASSKSLSRLVYADVKNVITSDYYVSKVGSRLFVLVFCSTFKNDVHMAIAVYHLTSILDVILQFECDFLMYLLDQ